MNQEKTVATLEAVLFASGEPITIDRLADVFELPPEKVEEYIRLLSERLKKRESGMKLLRLSNAYQLATKEEYEDYIRRAMDLRRRIPLSAAALEVLAVVAYNQPVTKSFVEQVRGVDCSGVIATLTEKELIEERGRLELPGRPLLYGTTKNFLRCFSISDLSDLPPLPKEKMEVAEVGEQLAIETEAETASADQ